MCFLFVFVKYLLLPSINRGRCKAVFMIQVSPHHTHYSSKHLVILTNVNVARVISSFNSSMTIFSISREFVNVADKYFGYPSPYFVRYFWELQLKANAPISIEITALGTFYLFGYLFTCYCFENGVTFLILFSLLF